MSYNRITFKTRHAALEFTNKYSIDLFCLEIRDGKYVLVFEGELGVPG